MVEVEQSAIAQSSAVQEVTLAMGTVAEGSTNALRSIARVEDVASNLRANAGDVARLISTFRAGDDLPQIAASAAALCAPRVEGDTRDEVRDENEEHQQRAGGIGELV